MQPFVPGNTVSWIHSLKILKCGMMGYNSWTKIILVDLSKNIGARTVWANLGQNYATVCLMILSLMMFLKFYAMTRHNRQKKLALVIFSKSLLLRQYSMGPILPKITQPFITLTALEIFRNILACFGAIAG